MSRAKKIEEAARAVLDHIDCTHTDGDHPCKVYRGGACTCGAQKAINAYVAVEAAFALPPDDERGALERLRKWNTEQWIRAGKGSGSTKEEVIHRNAIAATHEAVIREIDAILADMPQQQPAQTDECSSVRQVSPECELVGPVKECAEWKRLQAELNGYSVSNASALALLEATQRERDEWKAKAEKIQQDVEDALRGQLDEAHNDRNEAVDRAGRLLERLDRWRDVFSMPDENDADAIERAKKEVAGLVALADANGKLVGEARAERDEWKARAEKAEADVSKVINARLFSPIFTSDTPPLPESMKETPDALRLERDGWKMRAEAAEARAGTTTDTSKDADALQAALDLVAYLIDRRNRYGEGVEL